MIHPKHVPLWVKKWARKLVWGKGHEARFAAMHRGKNLPSVESIEKILTSIEAKGKKQSIPPIEIARKQTAAWWRVKIQTVLNRMEIMFGGKAREKRNIILRLAEKSFIPGTCPNRSEHGKAMKDLEDALGGLDQFERFEGILTEIESERPDIESRVKNLKTKEY